MKTPDVRAARTPTVRLLLITFLAVLIHGYHLGVDDSEIYIPAIKRVADPALYPFGDEFFMTHARLSIFSNLVGGFARLTHIPVDASIFLWHVTGIFLLLLAAWRLLTVCFKNDYARWSGVALLAATLSVPVAGTALVIMDPYLTARSISTPTTLLAIAFYISGKRATAVIWLVLTALVHPQMSVYCAVFLGCLESANLLAVHARTVEAAMTAPAAAVSMAGIPFLFEFEPARGFAREALLSRTYFLVSNWTWYEWVGIFAPLAMLWWLSPMMPRGTTPMFRRLSRTLVPFGILFTLAGIVLAIPARLENFTRLQPMRAFHLLYAIFFALLGGVLGEYVLKRDLRRWAVLFIPVAALMWGLQHQAYAASAHLEWPGVAGENPWTSAFVWIRGNTPKDAVFALDPDYMAIRGEDQHGFRAVAERSALADNLKDSGAVSLFPQLANDWKSQVLAQSGWVHFQPGDFRNLAERYPVTWVVTQHPEVPGLLCPYSDGGVSVCRIQR